MTCRRRWCGRSRNQKYNANMADVWANSTACHPRATSHTAGCKNSIRHIETRFSPYFIFLFLMQFRLRRAAAFVSSPIHLFYLWTCLVIFVSAANWADGTVAGAFSAPPPCRNLQRLIAWCQWVGASFQLDESREVLSCAKLRCHLLGGFLLTGKFCVQLFSIFLIAYVS